MTDGLKRGDIGFALFILLIWAASLMIFAFGAVLLALGEISLCAALMMMGFGMFLQMTMLVAPAVLLLATGLMDSI